MKQFNHIFSFVTGVAVASSALAQTYVQHVVNQAPQLTVDAGQAMSFCIGDTLTLGGNPTANGGTIPYGYDWQPGTGLSSTSVPNPVATPLASTTYSLMVTDAEGCTQGASLALTLISPAAAFTASTNALQVSFTDLSTFATSWAWDFGDGGTATAQNPVHSYASAGSYHTCLTINGGTACEETSCDSIHVTAVGVLAAWGGIQVQVYPNPTSGDRLHFAIAGVGANGDIGLQLYDLQGKCVMSCTHPSSQTLLTVSRNGLAAGTYHYRVQQGGALLGSGNVVLR